MEQLLKILSENARMGLEDLAAMLNVPPQRVAQMLDEYAEQGIIQGYHTVIDWERAGVQRVQALIDLHVTPKRDCGFDAIAQTLASFDEVSNVMLMSGGYDLSVMVIGRSFQEIALFVARRLSTLEGVLKTRTHFILHTYKQAGVLCQTEQIDEREQQ